MFLLPFCVIVSAIMGVSFFRAFIALTVNTISPLADNSEIYTKELILPGSLPPTYSLMLLRIEPNSLIRLIKCLQENNTTTV